MNFSAYTPNKFISQSQIGREIALFSKVEYVKCIDLKSRFNVPCLLD